MTSVNGSNPIPYLQKSMEYLNIEGVKEIEGSVAVAQKKTQNNGLDEVFIQYKGKNYMAYGKGINMDEMSRDLTNPQRYPIGGKQYGPGHVHRVKGAEDIVIKSVQNESNTFGEGYSYGRAEFKSRNMVPGYVVGAVQLGSAIGTAALASKFLGGGRAGVIGFFVGMAGGLVGMSVGTGVYKGIESANKPTNYNSLNF